MTVQDWTIVVMMGIYFISIVAAVHLVPGWISKAYNTGLDAGYRKSQDLPPDIKDSEDEALAWLAKHSNDLPQEDPGEDEEAGNGAPKDYMLQMDRM